MRRLWSCSIKTTSLGLLCFLSLSFFGDKSGYGSRVWWDEIRSGGWHSSKCRWLSCCGKCWYNTINKLKVITIKVVETACITITHSHEWCQSAIIISCESKCITPTEINFIAWISNIVCFVDIKWSCGWSCRCCGCSVSSSFTAFSRSCP